MLLPRVAEEADRPARPGYKQVQAVDYRAKGYEVAFSDRSPRGYQIVYEVKVMAMHATLVPATNASWRDS